MSAEQKFTCFNCGDGNTPLYCLNCAQEVGGWVRKEDVVVMADVLREALAYFNRFQIHGPLRNRLEAAVDRAKEKGFA